MAEEETILKTILEKLREVSLMGSQTAEKFLTECAQSGTFMDACLTILQINSIPLNIRQQTASIIAKILIDHSDMLTTDRQINLVERLIPNWEISSDVKKMMVNSITHLLANGDQVFRDSVKSLLDTIVGILQDLHRQYTLASNLQEDGDGNLVDTCKSKESSILFEEISQTILLLSTSLLQSICQSEDDYLSHLMQKIKTFHCILFDCGDLRTDHTVFLKLFNFYQDWAALAFQHKQDLNHWVKQIVEWPFILDNLVMIYKFGTTPTDQTEQPINLLASTDYEFLAVKTLAAEFHKQLINFNLEIARIGGPHSTPTTSPHFIQSLHLTAQYIAQHLSSMPDSLMQYSLSLFSLYSSCISLSSINFQQATDIVFAVLFPIMDLLVCKSREMFEDDVADFYNEIQDCCECQSMETFLSEISQTLQIVIDKCPQIYQFLIQQCQKSFDCILTADQAQNIPSSLPTTVHSMNNSTMLFLSALLYHNQLTNDDFKQILTIVATPQFYIQLDSYEKALLYWNLENSWHEIFEQIPEHGQFFLLQSLNPNLHKSTRYFALFFVSQNCDIHFYQSFITTFFSTFNFAERDQEKWRILSKTIQTYSEQFSQICICQLMQTLHLHIQQGLRYCNYEIGKGRNIDCSIIASYIYICELISKLFIRDRNKTEIRKEIFKFLKVINELKPVHLDDNVIRTANYIFEEKGQLAQQFTDYLPYVNRNFMENNYNGDIYYQFFGKYIMCGQHYQNCLQPIAVILLMAVQRHTSNPQTNVSDDALLTINNSLILLQNLCVIHGKTIHQKITQQILTVCEQITTMIYKSKKEDVRTTLIGRTLNLEIICRFTANLEIPFDRLVQNSRQSMFVDYDAQLLMHLLQKISLNMKTLQKCDQIITTILYLLRSTTSKTFHCKNLKKDMNQKRYNNILDIIQKVFDTNKPLACLAAVILEKYNFYDWNYVKSIHPAMKVTDYKFILHNIEEAPSLSLSTLSLEKKQENRSIIEIRSTRTIVRVVNIKKSTGVNSQQDLGKANVWALTNTTSSGRQDSGEKTWKRKSESYYQMDEYLSKRYTM